MTTSPMILDASDYRLPLDMGEVFRRPGQCALEIGFGEGDFLIEMGLALPDWNFIGIEIKRYRFKKAVKKAEREGAQNLRLLLMDAEVAVADVFRDETFDRVYINFPDPWPKERHKKHRIVSGDFLRALSNVMKPEGALEVASDFREYVFEIIEAAQETGLFRSEFPHPGYVNEIPARPATKFEAEFRTEGRKIYYLRFGKSAR
ncbi:MAG: tRNA (guanosine(46)-N7)-methyltransferase TrmB [Deltaproteobacteria bacterium]